MTHATPVPALLIPPAAFTLVRRAFIFVDTIDGCDFNAGNDAWLQSLPPPQKQFTAHARIQNYFYRPIAKGKLSAWIGATQCLKELPVALPHGAELAIQFAIPAQIVEGVHMLRIQLSEPSPTALDPNHQAVTAKVYIEYEARTTIL